MPPQVLLPDETSIAVFLSARKYKITNVKSGTVLDVLSDDGMSVAGDGYYRGTEGQQVAAPPSGIACPDWIAGIDYSGMFCGIRILVRIMGMRYIRMARLPEA
jgi:hypothetical protein